MDMDIVSQIHAALGRHRIDRIDALAVLGSGMGSCFAPGEYRQLYDHGASGVAGHRGTTGLIERNGKHVLLSFGRRHLYEGCTGGEVTAMVNAAASLGARTLILTNAAGGLDPALRAGDIMMIEDCLATLLGRHALAAGSSGGAASGRRAIFATVRYDAIDAAALQRGVGLRRGIYAAVPGPSYETRAEIAMLRRMGADAVGMSTALEAAEGAALGMEVIGMSLITNVLTDTTRVPLDHADVVEQGGAAAGRLRRAIDAALEILT